MVLRGKMGGRGATGPTGPAGPAGGTGATGPAGIASIIQVENNTTDAGPGLVQVNATCPSGYVLTGGGAGVGLTDAGNSFVESSIPEYGDSTTTWAVIYNLAGVGEDVSAVAICAELTP
jgi:hypothetical protein